MVLTGQADEHHCGQLGVGSLLMIVYVLFLLCAVPDGSLLSSGQTAFP